MVNGFHTMVSQVMQVTDWLDPVATRNFVTKVIQTDTQPEGDFAKWHAEASLDEYGALRLFSLLSPIFTVLTFATCVWHTKSHLREIVSLGGSPMDGPQHDRTIIIVALPLFYCLMSFLSVIRTWQVCINHVGDLTGPGAVKLFTSFDERQGFLFQMYDANFVVADVYETWALVVFGKLLTTELNHMIKKELQKVATTQEVEMGDDLKKIIRDLRHATRDLTLAGVRLFNYACLAQAGYIVFITTMGFYGYYPEYFSPDIQEPGFFQTNRIKNQTKYLFVGMGAVASSAAIGNLMDVEEKFTDFFWRFSPSAKFWSTKILVTLAFLQSILLAVIPPFSGWTETRSNLLYSSLLCAECFLLSLLHLKAWSPGEEWYHKNKKDGTQTLLENDEVDEFDLADDAGGSGSALASLFKVSV